MTTVFGDAEAATVDILREDAAVAAIGNVTVGVDLVGYAAPARWVKVTRTGGLPTLWMAIDNAQITVECYAENKGAAFDLAAAARAAIFSARYLYSGQGLYLYDVNDAEGLTWAPDEPTAGAPRYTFALSLATKPL